MLQLRKLFHEKLYGCIKMRLVIVIDSCIDLYAYSETMGVTDREHESLPWSRGICQEIMDFCIVGVYWKMHEFQSGISKFFHIWETRAHHTIRYDTRFYTCLSCIRYPSRQIWRECGLTTRKYHSPILTHDKVIDYLYSFFIRNIESIRRVRTKVTGIITMSIHLNVTNIGHSYLVKGLRRLNQYDLIKLICNHSQLSLYLQDLQRVDFLR